MSFFYGTKYGSAKDLERGFLIDGSFSEKFKRNEERMDRYRAYNNPDDPGISMKYPMIVQWNVGYDNDL
ncbi:hypothetical protein Ct9H90mP29_20620 [bacterium]|nr:MAG: hypothetical protein Ct9H90mP29_20620 [bacterium]